VEEALESAAPGDVLVINGEAFTEAVMMGGLMCGRAKQRGLAGVIIDGAVRDVAELRKLQWPVFASGITPRAGTFAKLGQLKVPVCCGNVVIQPGDMVAGDEDGIVAIPARALGKALTLACEIEKRESFITEAIERGLSIPEAAKEYEIRQG
jgi:regulator of RNase E activity RraA